MPVVLPAGPRWVLAGLVELVAAELSGRQALAELAGVLQIARLADRFVLRRTADADARGLVREDGARSLGPWVAQHGGGASAQQLTVARKLGSFPAVRAGLLDGTLTVTAGQQLQSVLGKLRPHLDRTEGLLDGQDAEATVILGGVRMIAAQARGGFPTGTDPTLKTLLAQLPRIAALAVPQAARLEQAFVLLAQHVEGAQLPGALQMLIEARCRPGSTTPPPTGTTGGSSR